MEKPVYSPEEYAALECDALPETRKAFRLLKRFNETTDRSSLSSRIFASECREGK